MALKFWALVNCDARAPKVEVCGDHTNQSISFDEFHVSSLMYTIRQWVDNPPHTSVSLAQIRGQLPVVPHVPAKPMHQHHCWTLTNLCIVDRPATPVPCLVSIGHGPVPCALQAHMQTCMWTCMSKACTRTFSPCCSASRAPNLCTSTSLKPSQLLQVKWHCKYLHYMSTKPMHQHHQPQLLPCYQWSV